MCNSRTPQAISTKLPTHITYLPKNNTMGVRYPRTPRMQNGKGWQVKVIHSGPGGTSTKLGTRTHITYNLKKELWGRFFLAPLAAVLGKGDM